MLRRHGGEAAGQEIVSAVTQADLDKVALLAEVGDILGEHDLHSAVTSLAHLIALFRRHRKTFEQGRAGSVSDRSFLRSLTLPTRRALERYLFIGSASVGRLGGIRLGLVGGRRGRGRLPCGRRTRRIPAAIVAAAAAVSARFEVLKVIDPDFDLRAFLTVMAGPRVWPPV